MEKTAKLKPYCREFNTVFIKVDDSMIDFFEKKVTIVSLFDEVNCCHIKEDDGRWYWHKDWFEDIIFRNKDFRMLKPIA